MNHVLEYVQKYNISATTARRDLKELENEGIITMSYGGINFLEFIIKHVTLMFEQVVLILIKKWLSEKS
ncbi:DeoR family transcriptional regulator [Spiroplasma citri]|uniref:DeoR family transcriptional regulator n=1 Tax=Spiroplasma citri TaxID=2133 RepID=UPI001EF93B67|nr:DeoR family transcriptional regulator [Spiroplasma citri]